MLYYSENDIEEMKTNGYDEVTIDAAKKIQEKADQLISHISSAFKDVALEDGIGLYEGQGIDDYQDNATLKKLREDDEKEDWSIITNQALNACYSSLCFFDAKGMRFHLPAFMIAQIKMKFDQEVAYSLTNLNEYSTAQLTALSRAQKDVIIKFLKYFAEDNDYEFERLSIDKSIKEYWLK